MAVVIDQNAGAGGRSSRRPPEARPAGAAPQGAGPRKRAAAPPCTSRPSAARASLRRIETHDRDRPSHQRPAPPCGSNGSQNDRIDAAMCEMAAAAEQVGGLSSAELRFYDTVRRRRTGGKHSRFADGLVAEARGRAAASTPAPTNHPAGDLFAARHQRVGIPRPGSTRRRASRSWREDALQKARRSRRKRVTYEDKKPRPMWSRAWVAGRLGIAGQCRPTELDAPVCTWLQNERGPISRSCAASSGASMPTCRWWGTICRSGPGGAARRNPRPDRLDPTGRHACGGCAYQPPTLSDRGRARCGSPGGIRARGSRFLGRWRRMGPLGPGKTDPARQGFLW